ncbi:hypothetical protein Daus18300_010377 [Diaporthe australafricana]|uniref:Uncharacterized protein n=1 Tax=Diaporthe australafricana TaxID=127596 RepID=A0ABR3WAG8_9PEZI
MPTPANILKRSALALPFFILATICFREMDVDLLAANNQPFIKTRQLTWPGGSVPMLWDVFHIDFLDESGLLIFIAQLFGIGNIGPIFYGLCYVFCPSATELSRLSAEAQPSSALPKGAIWPLLPLLLLFHNSHVFGMYLASDFSTRQLWTLLWQFSPAWIGICFFAAPRILDLNSPSKRKSYLSSPTFVLLILSLVSAVVWITLLVADPYSLSTLLIPEAGAQVGFVEHSRRALQIDELSSVGAAYLWLVYLFFDLSSAGLADLSWVVTRTALLPMVAVLAGPGAAVAVGWSLRERKLSTVSQNKPQE